MTKVIASKKASRRVYPAGTSPAARHAFMPLAVTAAIVTLFVAGCRPAPSTQQAPPPTPVGVTTRTEQALDSQPAAGSVRQTVDRDKGLVDLNQVALFYANNQADGAQVRDSVLKDLQKNMPKVYQAVQQGDLILLSGDPGVAPAGASNTIVAYMRDAPTRGGVAAFLDGHTRNITVQDFQNSAKLGM